MNHSGKDVMLMEVIVSVFVCCQRRNNCVAVIGDGAITGGMAFEAMNCAGYLDIRHLVILNDNGQVCE